MDDNFELQYAVNEYGDVTISMDLTEYIDAHARKDNDPDRYSQAISSLRSKLEDQVVDNYFSNIMDLSLQGLPEARIHEIWKSPAIEILMGSFVEILRNAIDETIQANHADKSNSTCMQMTIRIDNDTNPNLVSVDIIDNGRGFPDKFLDKVQISAEKRNDYILEFQEVKKLKKQDAHLDSPTPYSGPALVGGHGLGLKYFLADAQNDELVGQGKHKKLKNAYPKSDDYSLDFGNLQDISPEYRGGIIRLQTPLAPRVSLADLMMDIKDRKRDIETPSPETTTNESVTSKSSLTLDLDFSDDPDDNQGFSPR